MTAGTHNHDTVISADDRRRYGRRAQLLAAVSVVYNVVEALIAVTAGLVAGSVALVGFGLDSIVEVSSGLIILWQFRHLVPESREKSALRLMAFSFFGLATYIAFESVRSLATGHEPESSIVGIILAATSLVVMPFLSGLSVAPDAPSARTPWSLTQPKPCYAPTCPPSCSLACSSTPRSAGHGPTPSRGLSSPPSPSRKAERRGAVKDAAAPSEATTTPTMKLRTVAVTRRPTARTAAVQPQMTA